MGVLLIFFIPALSCLAQNPLRKSKTHRCSIIGDNNYVLLVACEQHSQCGSNESSICIGGLCECKPDYFSPGGSAADCKRIDGKMEQKLCKILETLYSYILQSQIQPAPCFQVSVFSVGAHTVDLASSMSKLL